MTFVQRFGGSLNTNVHFHMLALDGVYAPRASGGPEFFALRAPEITDIVRVVENTARCVAALLKRQGSKEEDTEDSDRLRREDPWLSTLYGASVTGRIATGEHAGRQVQTGGDRVDPEVMEVTAAERCARLSGFSLHANVALPARDRERLERLCRYVARPPLASERLTLRPDERLVYEFKRPWRDGTAWAVYEPLEFIEKLAALVPTPRAHLARYHGVLAPAARWRASVVTAVAVPPTPIEADGVGRASLGNFNIW